MADDDTEVSPEDSTLIDELLADGFTYSQNGRVEGLADEDTEDVGDDTEPDDVGGDDDAEPSGDAVDEPAGPADGPVRSVLAGTELEDDEARGLLHLRQLLINNPDLAQQVNRVLSGEPAEKPTAVEAEAPKLPDEIDPDDRTAILLWTELQKVSQRIDPVQEQVAQSVEQANQARIASEINEAVTRFRASHPDLDDADINNIRNHTSANVNISGVMSNFPGDPVEGLTRALEIGSLTDPATRDKVLQITQSDREAKDEKRKRNTAALSGGTSGGSRKPAPKKPPGNWNEVAKELAKAIENGTI